MEYKYIAFFFLAVFAGTYFYHALKNLQHKRKYKYCRNRTLTLKPLATINKEKNNV